MVNPVSKVFQCQDLRLLIWSFALPRRCNSCHQKLTKPLKPLYTHYKDYNNTHWRSAENLHMEKVCNWCYYYVYEIIC